MCAKIKNRYFLEDDIQYLEITKLSGQKVYFVIDKEYLNFMQSKIWYAMYCPKRCMHFLESNDKIKYHRYITNCPENLVVDHIDGNTYDNRLSNLQICTVGDNNRNRHKPHIQHNPKPSNTGITHISYLDNGAGNFYYVVNFKGTRKRFKKLEGAIMFLNQLKKRNEVNLG